jgi:hypothetical protein
MVHEVGTLHKNGKRKKRIVQQAMIITWSVLVQRLKDSWWRDEPIRSAKRLANRPKTQDDPVPAPYFSNPAESNLICKVKNASNCSTRFLINFLRHEEALN